MGRLAADWGGPKEGVRAALGRELGETCGSLRRARGRCPCRAGRGNWGDLRQLRKGLGLEQHVGGLGLEQHVGGLIAVQHIMGLTAAQHVEDLGLRQHIGGLTTAQHVEDLGLEQHVWGLTAAQRVEDLGLEQARCCWGPHSCRAR